METLFVLFPVATTSIIIYKMAAANRRTGASMRQALRILVEFVGAFVFFFALNVSVRLAIVFLIRGFTPFFVPLYQLQNLLSVVLSAAQAFVFQQWWQHGAQPAERSRL